MPNLLLLLIEMRPSAAVMCQGLLGICSGDHCSLCCQDNLGHTLGSLLPWATGMYHILKLYLLHTACIQNVQIMHSHSEPFTVLNSMFQTSYLG